MQLGSTCPHHPRGRICAAGKSFFSYFCCISPAPSLLAALGGLPWLCTRGQWVSIEASSV